MLGGARSGKTRHAMGLAEMADARVYLATAEPLDTEMAARIAHHRADRADRDARWTAIEEPVDLAGVLARESRPGRAIVVDCLTLWLTNLMVRDHDIEAAIEALSHALAQSAGPVILVSNEVGLGIVPMDPMARAFRDHAGRMHQRFAAQADTVFFVIAGLPQRLKG